MRALVTVGSTQFDELVKAALSVSVLRALRDRGYTHLAVQCGKYKGTELGAPDSKGVWLLDRHDVKVEVWRYKPSLQQDFETSDLVISHAGSGTIIEVLRMGKPLITVPNPTLLDNHQVDLATELEKLSYLKASSPSTLAADIAAFMPSSLKPFPPMDGSRFRDLLDREMGFL